jgi:hypothetical protein
MSPGFDWPLYILPFNHCGWFETGTFGSTVPLTLLVLQRKAARMNSISRSEPTPASQQPSIN